MMNRVLILSASAGAGHIRAGQALEKAFASGLARDVRHVDALQYASPAFRAMYSKAYLKMIDRAPTMLGWLYDKADKPWENEKRRLAFDRMHMRPLVKEIQAYAPDLVVCTHFLPAEIVSWLLCTRRIRTHHAVVITDFDLHAYWLCHHYCLYFVALEETRQHLNQLGFAPEKTIVSGIPIARGFTPVSDKEAVRARLGLSADPTTLLVSAGGFGVGPMEEILKALMPVRHDLQVVALCGKNSNLKIRVEQFARTLPPDSQLRIKPVGYASNMDEYMAASDLIIGKPGGLTTSEALAAGLGLVIVNPIPGQEERNSDHLLEQGAAIRANNLPCLAYKIDTLLDDPLRLAKMQEKALALGRPHAANTIAELLHASTENDCLPAVDGGHTCRDWWPRPAPSDTRSPVRFLSRA